MASTSQYSQWSYDVFLSFSGEDTRTNFTDHLYSSLIRCKINTFRDNEKLPKGGKIAPELFHAIEESRIAIVVFSKTYAVSKWCLEELAKIINCKEERGQKVIPIFYHVDPSEVRHQNGIYEEVFAHHEENADEDKKKKIRRWKTAMWEAGNLAGYHVKGRDSYESVIVDDIIKQIRGIIPMVLDLNENIVGMDTRLKKLISMLELESNDDVRMVGVCGLGGIGKTTIIIALHNEISNQFRSISFLTNVKDKCTKESGMLKLQQQLLDDTLGVKGQLTLKNIHEGVKVIKDMLSSKKVLIFLDDIDDSKQLEYLAGKHSWFGDGSRIIITTRRKDLLNSQEVTMYEVDKLNPQEALQLFCCYAFKQHLPMKGYIDVSDQVVQHVDGLPLALKVLGSLLFGKELKFWVGELKKLEQVPNMDIIKVLKISYDGLDEEQKSIFLDIACFFRGTNVEGVVKILDVSGFNTESGINALVDRCLITISKDNLIEMHDLLTQMGKEMVHQEYPKKPGKRSRLWRHTDVWEVLTENMGTKNIEGIVFDDESTTQKITFTAKAFQRMTRLRVLCVDSNRVQLSEDFAFPSGHLTYLWWNGYALASLPSNFHANNLVYLCLNNSNIKRLWEGSLRLNNLSCMDLSDSQQLIEIPKFSTMPNLEYIILSGCVSLESLPGDIYKLKHLLRLHCKGCSKLASFPEIKSSFGKLTDLRLDGTAIKELPSSFGLLKDLRAFCLNNCKNLESLPDSFCKLVSLKALILNGCTKLGKLPSLSGLSQLKALCLDECNLTPGVIKRDNRLNELEELTLRNCNLNEGGDLNQIFHLCSLKVLDLSGCSTEEGVFLNDMLVGISQLCNLRALGLRHCKKLSQIPELPSSLRLLDAHNSIGTSMPLMHSLVNCLESANQDWEYKRSSDEVRLTDSWYYGQGICIVVQGSSGIPEWIRNQEEGCDINIELPKVWDENNEFLGVAICCVYVPLSRSEGIPENNDSAHESDEIESDDESVNESKEVVKFESWSPTELACVLTFGDDYGSPPMFRQDLQFVTDCKSNHNGGEQMWVTLYPKVALMEIYSSNQFTTLEAGFLAPNKNCKVLKCGFQPIYAYDPTSRDEDVVDVDDISCFDCTRNVENREICLKGQPNPINQLSCIPTAVDTLCLRDCKNLESLPTSIWDQFKYSLKSLFCSNCTQLWRFPQVLTNMKYLTELHLDGTAIQELPSSIQHLNRLQILNLRACQQLMTLPESICNLFFLEVLEVSYCPKLQKLPQNLGKLKRLKRLLARGLNSMCCQSLSLSGLCSLKSLHLSESKLIMHGGIISTIRDICCLSSLQELDLSHCKLDEGGIPSEFWSLSSLEGLYLYGNRFRSIPSGINQLSMLTVLDLSHCLGLVQIADLPSSLRLLDVHGCRFLETSSPLLSFSLFKCFISVIQGLECKNDVSAGVNVFIPGSSGIPKWIKPQKKGSEVVAKLPQDWYKDSDLLGFVLYSTYDDPVLHDNESEAGEMDGAYFKCDLSLLGHEQCQLVDDLSCIVRCNCSQVMWLFYHPKVAIEKKHWSNQWKQLKASFCGCSDDGKAMKVKECGIHLIYASNAHEHINPASVGKSLIPSITICPECQEDEQSGSQLKLSEHGDAINELPNSIECSSQPDSLSVWGCKNLRSLPSDQLKSLIPLLCLGSQSFPETLDDIENLEQLHLDGTAIEELPMSIQHLKGLQFLNLDYCNNLVSLPESICDLKSLTNLSCLGCSNLRKFPEIRGNMESLIKLDLGGSAIEALPSSIQNLRGLQILNLRLCNNLRSLPSTMSELKSLKSLFCSGCSQLRSFPEILGDMGNLRRLDLDKTAIEELPESIQHLQGLQYLDLTCCNHLARLPKSICYLKSLITLPCSSCSNLREFAEILENMENLKDLDLRGTSIKELPSSIQHLQGLQHLYLQNCRNLVNIPESICKLSSLKELYVDFCTDLKKFPENLGSLQCLETLGVSDLNLSMDCFSNIAADIIRLPKLRILNLSHCPQLLQVPDLPPTLRTLDVHNCTCLENLFSLWRLLDFSLLKCFKSAIEELECDSHWNKAIRVITPGNNGIPEWIRQREKGSQITAELPLDWHKNNDFLGFAIYSVCIPTAPGSLNCKLNFCGDGDGDGSGYWDVDDFQFSCCQFCVGSNQMCVIFYPKLAIEKHYWSNKWRRLKASFHGHDGLPVKVRECGIHLIYTENISEDTGTDTDIVHRRWEDTQGTKHNDQLMIEYNDEQRSHDETRSAAQDDNNAHAQTSDNNHVHQLMTDYYNDEQRSCDDTSRSAAAEDASTSAQTSSHHSQFTEHSHNPPMDKTTQNVNSNVVDDQDDDEDDRTHNWLELLGNFVQWICCRR